MIRSRSSGNILLSPGEADLTGTVFTVVEKEDATLSYNGGTHSLK